MKLNESKLSFMAIKETGSYDSNNYEVTYGSNVDQLLQYSVCTLPPNNTWIELKPSKYDGCMTRYMLY